MKKFKEFDIPFVGLKQGEHRFDYRIDNSFFEEFGYTDFNETSLKVDVVLHKKQYAGAGLCRKRYGKCKLRSFQ